MKYCLFNIAFWGLLFFNLFEATANSNIYTISGRVTEAKTSSPLPGASILIKGTYLWAVSNQKGEFTIHGVQEGKYQGERSITCTSYYSLYFFNPNDFISYFLVPSTRFPLSCHSQFDIALF